MKRNLQLATKPDVDIERELCIIIANVFGVDESEIHRSSRFRDDLGADSLDLVMLIVAISNVFDAEIHDRDVVHIQTVGEVIAYLEQQTAVIKELLLKEAV